MADAQISAERRGADLLVALSGDWNLHRARPDPAPVFSALDEQKGGALEFNADALGTWDSSLAVVLSQLDERCQRDRVEFRVASLPGDLAELLALSQDVPEAQTGREDELPATVVNQLGELGIETATGSAQFLEFVGESALSLVRVLMRQGVFNWRDFWQTLESTSVGALPIVGLISFLTGLILAFVGSLQLEKFGATIYVANLVGLGMVREMGSLMTAIIMAGRTGAAFAAQLGSMKVNEEIDALKTLAISPQDFLVTPRLLALFIMMPLLCLYADLIGIIGGSFVGLGLMGVSFAQYVHQTRIAVQLLDISTGLIKGVAFGGIVALAGCLRGIQCGSNASAVGIAATSAVVTGITLIVASDALFDVLFNVLKI